MEHLTIPAGYRPALSLHDTQVAIKTVKDFFQSALAQQLNLQRVSAPLFVTPESGLNDNLNGVERPVRFGVKEQDERTVEIVQSLAKWKRMALGQYGFALHEGLYADMNAIRRDETTDNIHSIYVDQWDWERVIAKEERTVETLKETVRRVYKAIKKTEKFMAVQYDYIEEILPKEIFFITSQELLDRYPDKSPREREYAITREKGAVFVIGIGDRLSDGARHDGRAPDYDDWSMNGDILVYYPVLERSLAQTAARKSGLSGARRAAVPEGDPGSEAAVHGRRRHRAEPHLHVLSPQGAHRRGAGFRLARFRPLRRRGRRHPAAVIMRNSN